MGTRIDGALRRAGMTQRELAERLHVDPAQVSRIVRGAMQRPSLELVCRMAEELGASVDVLVGNDGAAKDSVEGATAALLDSALPTADASSEADWRRVAVALAEGDRIRAEAERSRVTEVDAVLQQTIRELFHREQANRRDASSSRYAGRVEAAAGGAS